MKKLRMYGIGSTVVLGFVVALLVAVPAKQGAAQGNALRASSSDIGGVVNSAKGPEAGVWVIAETTDLPTKFVKIVVTDDNGRYLIPELPKASYQVWVRGYGLVDSIPVDSNPGKTVNLKAVIAPTPKEAAQYYPADYWYSLIQVPDKSEFPMKPTSAPPFKTDMAAEASPRPAVVPVAQQQGAAKPAETTGNEETGIFQGRTMASQEQWIDTMKQGCELCHQLGDLPTRDLTHLAKYNFSSSEQAWATRIHFGQAGYQAMSGTLARFVDQQRAIKMFADWTDRIAAGELPPVPPRPQGLERNVVISMWDWGGVQGHPHDEIATDRRNPTINANGKVYAADYNADAILWVDPVKNTSGSDNPFAQYFPMDSAYKHAAVYDPETGKFTLIDTCFATHHLQLAEDKDNTMFFSSPGGQAFGWINSRVLDSTGDAKKAQGWCPAYLDSNGDGKIDPKVDKRIAVNGYGLVISPVDGSIWMGTTGPTPGHLLRITLGSNPPTTCMAEIYEPPFNNPKMSGVYGYAPRGVDIDRNGVVWTALSGSSQLASFDRRKCKVTNGATATGQHCPEGWTLYTTPGPKMKGVTDDSSADFEYYNWVDQFDTLGLGKNIPIVNGTGSDSLEAYIPEQKKWVVMRVPYPLGFYSRGMDGRIDNPNGGWKGRGIWATYGEDLTWHTEGGPGTLSKAVKFQIRPNPLAD
jgi:hypothetical protein